MNQSNLQKIKEELEAQEKQDFRNAMKNKVKERVDTKGLPHYAKVNNKNIIECQICRFTTKDQLTFFNHVKTKKHQSALEQLNRMQQAQAQPKPQAQTQSQGVVNGKRAATQDLYVDSEDFKEGKPKPKAQQVTSLVSYQEDDDDEADIGPAPVVQGKKDGDEEMREPERNENNEDRVIVEEMSVEKPATLPQGFFDQQESIEEMRKRETMEKTMQDYKNFMEEIKKTGGEDAEEILKEIQGEQPPPLEEAEQEILDKVIKEDEDVIEDAHDYISNLRKRITGKAKADTQAGKVEDKNHKKEDTSKRNNKMEDEEDGVGMRWKKRGLF